MKSIYIQCCFSFASARYVHLMGSTFTKNLKAVLRTDPELEKPYMLIKHWEWHSSRYCCWSSTSPSAAFSELSISNVWKQETGIQLWEV